MPNIIALSPKRYHKTLIKRRLTLGTFTGYKQEVIYNALLREQDSLYSH